MNSLFVINIYRAGGCWVFDDADKGLIAEPFVLGSSEMIDSMIGEKGVKECQMIFSSAPFPCYTSHIIRLDAEYDGYWYQFYNTNFEFEKGWLCPATTLYFGEHPENIYLKVTPVLQYVDGETEDSY